MKRRWQKIGIIAGGGDLPVTLAEGCRAREEPYFVIRLAGYADAALETHPGTECSIAEVGRIIRELKKQSCDAVSMAGLVHRPNFAALRPDWRGAALLPKVVTAARRGDGALLDVMVDTFAAEGFVVVGPEEIGTDLTATAGCYGSCTPGDRDLADIRKAAALVDALGPFDVGQGAVVRNGFVLAVEAAEGTDAMLERVATLPADVRGFEPGEEGNRRGVLLKKPKPGQELRVDLPTIGPRTVEKAAAAGLSGIAVLEGKALVVGRREMERIADAAGLFVIGLAQQDLREAR